MIVFLLISILSNLSPHPSVLERGFLTKASENVYNTWQKTFLEKQSTLMEEMSHALSIQEKIFTTKELVQTKE